MSRRRDWEDAEFRQTPRHCVLQNSALNPAKRAAGFRFLCLRRGFSDIVRRFMKRRFYWRIACVGLVAFLTGGWRAGGAALPGSGPIVPELAPLEQAMTNY